jgi:RNA polymerase sigma-70 factor (ECF subfamily)
MDSRSLQTQPDSLAALAQRHAAGVFRYLRALLGDGNAARDLTQDTFLRLRASADEAGPGLVFAAARSCALDHLRRRKVRERVEGEWDDRVEATAASKPAERPDRVLEDAESRADFLRALGQLPEIQRSVFHLSEIEGLSYAEIARVLQLSPGTIASRKHHAVRKLRELLRRRGHGT